MPGATSILLFDNFYLEMALDYIAQTAIEGGIISPPALLL